MNVLKLKQQGNRLRHRSHIWVWFLLALLIGFFICLSVPLIRRMDVFVAYVAAVWGVAYFRYQQHLETARFFKELVTEFNRRYDNKNNKLLAVMGNSEPFNQEQEQVFIDYFNLCAEEYLFYEMGYIYDCVWDAWYNGMKQFGNDMRVAELWKQEIQTDSYYDFEFPIEGTNKVNSSIGAKSKPTAAGQ